MKRRLLREKAEMEYALEELSRSFDATKVELDNSNVTLMKMQSTKSASEVERRTLISEFRETRVLREFR